MTSDEAFEGLIADFNEFLSTPVERTEQQQQQRWSVTTARDGATLSFEVVTPFSRDFPTMLDDAKDRAADHLGETRLEFLQAGGFSFKRVQA